MTSLLEECLHMWTSFETLEKFIFSLFICGCITSGGGIKGSYPAVWDSSFPSQIGPFTFDGASGQYAEFNCETAEHTSISVINRK